MIAPEETFASGDDMNACRVLRKHDACDHNLHTHEHYQRQASASKAYRLHPKGMKEETRAHSIFDSLNCLATQQTSDTGKQIRQWLMCHSCARRAEADLASVWLGVRTVARGTI